jgi:hypothetical protein
MCGACHDVRAPGGADLETTYAEWSTSAFSQPGTDMKTCGGCHMPGSSGLAADVPDAQSRTVHDHTMAALDVALGPFPRAAEQRKAIQLSLDSALQAKLCVNGPNDITITLENGRIGHAWPSGATHDRRAWAEVSAYRNGALVFSRGAGGVPPDPAKEPDALLLGRALVDTDGAIVPFLWQATGARGRVLTQRLPGGSATPAVARYSSPTSVDRVTMVVHVRAFPASVLDSLVASGDLAPDVPARVPVFSLASTSLEWTLDRGYGCIP